MTGKVNLRYKGIHGIKEELESAGFLGLTLGEEILFYREPLYRETAVCASSICFALQIRAEYILELGDTTFGHKGLSAEAMRNDMDLMFERISHVYNKKERWRIDVSKREK